MLTSIAELLARRFVLSVTVMPTNRAALQSVSIFLFIAAALAMVGTKRGFLRPRRLPFTAKNVLLHGLLPLFAPSLVEEIVYRVLFLPRADEHMPPLAQIGFVVCSLTLFVLAHPLRYYVRPSKRSLTFTDPTFLILATILGAGCTAAFLVSNSLWPPLLIHYSCVAIWLWFLGGAEKLSR